MKNSTGAPKDPREPAAGAADEIRLPGFFTGYSFKKLLVLADRLSGYLSLYKKKSSPPEEDLFTREFFSHFLTALTHLGDISHANLSLVNEGSPTGERLPTEVFFVGLKTRLGELATQKKLDCALAFQNDSLKDFLPGHKVAPATLPLEWCVLFEAIAFSLCRSTRDGGQLVLELQFRTLEARLFAVVRESILDGETLNRLVRFREPGAPFQAPEARQLHFLLRVCQDLAIPVTLNRPNSQGLQLAFNFRFTPHGEALAEASLAHPLDDFLALLTRSSEKLGQAVPPARAGAGRPGAVPRSELARKLQQCLLPRRFPRFPGCFVRARVKATGRCGGEFFAFHEPSDNCLIIVLGSIASDSLYSSLLIAVMSSILRDMENFPGKALNILNELNREMKKYIHPADEDRISATLLLFKPDENRVSVAVAGENPLYFQSTASGESGFREESADFLGLKATPVFFAEDFRVREGDLFLACSSGVLGAPERLEGFRQCLVRRSPGECLESGLDRYFHFLGERASGGEVSSEVLEFGVVALQVTDPFSFSYQIPSRLEFTHEVTAIVLRYADRYGLDSQSIYHLKLAVHEAVVNAIEHGNKFDPEKTVNVDFHLTPKKFLIRIRDQGGGYQPGDICNPIDPENVWKEGGRGLFLIRQLMDELHLNDQGNEITLVKNLAARPAPAPGPGDEFYG